MNEQLKQAIEDWVVQDQKKVDKQSHVGLCLLVLQQSSILRHADPEIMKQAGWVREEEWISVEDRLPELTMNVLVYGVKSNDKLIKTAIFHKGDKYNKDEFLMRGPDMLVTHWKPLPQPPKK